MTPNVVIIGNGTNCLSNQFGELIDSYDIIVRFNDYNIDGYESYIGTKTTYFVTHNNFLPVDPLLPKKFEHSIIWKMQLSPQNILTILIMNFSMITRCPRKYFARVLPCGQFLYSSFDINM
jgi:hypothetical protein